MTSKKKKMRKFDNTNANEQFINDYKSLSPEDFSNNPPQRTTPPGNWSEYPTSGSPDDRMKFVFKNIEDRDFYSGKITGYNHDDLERAARRVNPSIPEATAYFEKVNEIRGKKATKLHARYMKLSRRLYHGWRDR